MLRADNHFSRKSATAGASDSRGPTRFTQYEELAGSTQPPLLMLSDRP
jgi:hypothetical protein